MKFKRGKIILDGDETIKVIVTIYSCKTVDQLVVCMDWLTRLKLFDEFKISFRKKLEKHGYREGRTLKVMPHQEEGYNRLIAAIEHPLYNDNNPKGEVPGLLDELKNIVIDKTYNTSTGEEIKNPAPLTKENWTPIKFPKP